MNGIVILTENYTYEGGIVNKEPHGRGIFQYANGDRYVGECKFGKADGYGTYYFKAGGIYKGFFSYGKIDGVGTYTDSTNVYKGTWRRDRKHGSFYKTNLHTSTTYKQLWMKGKLITSVPVQYIQPDALQTTKNNPITGPKKYQTAYKGNEKKCITCMDKTCNATNVRCGHVCMCHECLSKCTRCPICRVPISQIIKLYVS
jgi:hypothetical protein